MTLRDRLVDILGIFHQAADRLKPLAPLLTRLVIGWAFVGAGLGKWQNLERTVGFFTNLGIPAPGANAALVATVELVGGVALLLGLGTRIFAALLSVTMVVAIITAEHSNFVAAFDRSSETGLTDVVPFVFLIFLLWLVAFGAGSLSVDRLLPGRHRAVA